MPTSVFPTAYEDFIIKHENDINGVKWTFNVATDYFKNATDVYLHVYRDLGSTLLLARNNSKRNGVSIESNTITWYDKWDNINLPPARYYYSLFYEDSSLVHPTVKISEGVLTIA